MQVAPAETKIRNQAWAVHAADIAALRAEILDEVRCEIETRHAFHRRELHVQIRRAQKTEHAQQAAETRHDARVRIVAHLAIIITGGGIGYMVTRFGIADVIAIAAGCIPPAVQEVFDFIKGL